MLSKNGNAVPVSGPLLDRIRRVVYIIEDGYTMPAYRANRVSLPLATELHIELLADPPAADTRTESLLQWYLDGLHLPVLQKLEVVIGPEPELIRPLVVHLPLLVSCKTIHVTNKTSLVESPDWALGEVGKEFMESLDRIRLERACDRLGIDLSYEWV